MLQVSHSLKVHSVSAAPYAVKYLGCLFGLVRAGDYSKIACQTFSMKHVCNILL